LAVYGYLSGFSVALAVGLIGLTHVGFDRLLGYGLKYPLGFGYRHLGRVGKEAHQLLTPQKGDRVHVSTQTPKEIG